MSSVPDNIITDSLLEKFCLPLAGVGVWEEGKGKEENVFWSCFNYVFRGAAGSWALCEPWGVWFWKWQKLSLLPVLLLEWTVLGTLVFSIYTMEVCEKERNVDVRGATPLLWMRWRSCRDHPGTKVLSRSSRLQGKIRNIIPSVMDWIVLPPNSYVEILTWECARI